MKRMSAMGVFIALLCLTLGGARAESLAVSHDGVAALIEGTGEVIVAPGTYTDMVRLTDTLLAAKDSDGYVLIGIDGAPHGDQRYDAFFVGDYALIYMVGPQYGALNRQGDEWIPCTYTALIENGAGGFLAFRSNPYDDIADGVYYIDDKGAESATGVKLMAVPEAFSNGFAAALSNDSGRYGYLDSTGQWAFAPQFAYAAKFTEGRALVMLDSGWGLIDTSGNWALTPRFDGLLMSQTLYVAISGQRSVTLFDPPTLERRYRVAAVDTLSAANIGRYAVIYTNVATHVVNERGETVWTGDETASVSAGLGTQWILRQGTWGPNNVELRDEMGQCVSAGWQALSPAFCVDDVGYYQYMTFPMQEDEYGEWDWRYDEIRVGLIDQAGRVCIPAQYEELIVVADGFLLGIDGDTWVLYDCDGSVLWRYTLSQ